MRFFRLPAIALFCMCASATPSLSQQVVLSQIKFTGDSTRTQAELLAFSGLKPGPSTQQAVQDAAQKLGDTGFYDDVNFQSNGTVLTYVLTPAAPSALLPLSVTNFVWWDDKDLLAALDGKIPLYHGGPVPIAGNTRAAIAAILEPIVAAKGVPEPKVSSQTVATLSGSHFDTIAYSIASPWVLIRQLTLLNGSAAMQPKLTRVVNSFLGQQWDKTSTPATLSDRLSQSYRSAGYLEAALTNLDRSDPTVSAQSIDVTLTATLSEGPQYHVSRLTWTGSPQLSAADFAHQALLKPGEIDTPKALGDSLDILSAAYFSAGYIDAKIDAPPQIDRAVHTVAYTITVQPGLEFRFRSVRYTGLPDDLQKIVAGAWHMQSGDIYDGTYPTRFLGDIPDWHKHGYSATQTLIRNPDHTVDVTLIFSPIPAGLNLPQHH